MSCMIPWQLDEGCCEDWCNLDPELRNRASTLAWAVTRLLTGGLVGACPVSYRPCVQECGACSGSILSPYTSNGQWFNGSPCGDHGCSCGPAPSIVSLPGSVAKVDSVTIDGGVLPTSAWRLVNGRQLIRTDGEPWPACQDLTAPDDMPGSFVVHYIPGFEPDTAALWAVGVLACEFTKACRGQKCRLPASVTSVSRQGVSMEFDNSMFSNGLTGIREVDAWLLSVNPNRLRVPPRVWSPDMRQGTFT